MVAFRYFASTAALLAGTLVAAVPLLGQAEAVVRFHGGLGLTTTSYRTSAAERSNTVDRSFGVQSIFEPTLYETIGFPVSIGWEYLGPICLDIDPSVNCGARHEEKTSLLFGSVGISLHGPPLPLGLGDRESADRPFVIVGREWVSRGIGDDGCLNCFLDSVRFRGGLFIEPGVSFGAGRYLTMNVGYRVYRGTSDLENRIAIRLITRDHRSF